MIRGGKIGVNSPRVEYEGLRNAVENDQLVDTSRPREHVDRDAAVW